MDKDKINLMFAIPFKIGIAGKENEMFNANAVNNVYCSECGIRLKEGDKYYYWCWDETIDEACPSADDGEYLLCPKCAKKRMR